MLTLVPNPHKLCIVPAAAPLVDRKLVARTKASAVLPTASLGLKPGGVMQTAAHPTIRASAHTERRVECPPELRAFTLRCLLKRCRRR